MAQVQRKIVHKQFNSPIALYSDVNVKATLDRELKLLNNGTVGIDFEDPSTTRTGNLAKSAVLAALEEEERERSNQKPGLKRVAWPPPPETYAGPVEHQQPQHQPISQQQSQPVPIQQVAQANVYPTAPTPNYPPVVSNPPPKAHQQRPASIHSFSSLQNQAPSKPLSPLPLLQTASPQFHSPSFSSPRGWSHVVPPRSPGAAVQQPKTFYTAAPIAPPFELPNSTSSLGQPQYQTNAAVQPNYAPQQNYAQQPSYAPQPNYAHQQNYAPQPNYAPQQNFAQQAAQPGPGYAQQSPAYAQQGPAYAQQPAQQQGFAQPQQTFAPQPAAQLPFQGNPLRKEAPVSQMPAPIYQSQPGASNFQGGANRRGDTKWPPSEYKQQSEIDNEERRRIAQGPAFRPKRVNKVDYREFFAQNALSGTFPGYRIPPGTTHVNE